LFYIVATCFGLKQDIILLSKVIQKSQLDATVIYWSIRSAQHVSGNLLPIIRSVRLRFSVSRSWWWAKYCPKHVELILLINKLLLRLVGSSVLLYLHW